ncbi:MAG: hypothetical protein R3A79_03630 [Nannocystaceae bacterium]
MRWRWFAVAAAAGCVSCTPTGAPQVAPEAEAREEGELTQDEREPGQEPEQGGVDEDAPKQAPAADLAVYEGVLDMDRAPAGKRFQGTWLRRDDGTSLLLSYRPMPEHYHLIERRVVVRGEHYSPQGQAIMAEHFRPVAIELAAGEPDPGPPPTELPLPPRAATGEALRARVGRWAEVHATLVEARPSRRGSDWREVVFRMDDGSEFVAVEAEWVVDKTYRPRFGRRVTVLGSVYTEEGALGFGTLVLCEGEVEGCGRSTPAIRR